jgi:4'-phosphopantetheinyl transferase EntD
MTFGGIDIANLASFFTLEKSAYPLFDDESNLAESFGEQRKIDFATGRFCARKAMESLGVNPQALLIGNNREPLWPIGITGSISHSRKMCGAIAGKNQHFKSLGLDIEEVGRVQSSVWNSIFTDVEQIFLNQFESFEQQQNATLLFAMKEAFYKFQFPITRKYLGFKEVELYVESSAIEFSIKNPDVEQFFSKSSVNSYHTFEHNHCICFIWQ